MAVSVNTVYQRVLAIANKEQRGYITPQEFNLLANQAQMKIFEQYFYDLNQFSRLHGNDTSVGDMLVLLEEKIAEFETHAAGVTSGTTLPTDLYKIIDIYHETSLDRTRYSVQKISKKDYVEYKTMHLPIVTEARPVYIQDSVGISVYISLSGNDETKLSSGVFVDYIRKPADAVWGYNVVVGQALYDASNSTDFELHPSEETSLVNEILELAGILMEKPQLVAITGREEDKKIQQQKI